MFEYFYLLGYMIDKFLKTRMLKKLPFPVISIGNISVGGTGKTPTVISIVHELKKTGFYPIVLTRGYKGIAKEPCFVVECADATKLYGDEPVMLYQHIHPTPIVKCSERYTGGIFALKTILNDKKIVFVLDDGFQHYQLHRDIDIVLIDGSVSLKDMELLPSGLLREPISALKRADIYVITKQASDNLQYIIKPYVGQKPIFYCEYEFADVRNLDNEQFGLEFILNKKVYAFCALANPIFFKDSLLKTGCKLVGFKTFRDHYRYTEGDLKMIVKTANNLNADVIVTTQKDVVKLFSMSRIANVYYLTVNLVYSKGFFDEIFNRLTLLK